MPTVPQYGNERVRETALPQVRVSVPNDVPALRGGVFGEKAIGTAVSFLNAEKKKADDVATTEAYSNASRFTNDLIYNPEDGLMTKKGKDSFGSLDEFGERFDKGFDEIEKTLSNEDQKDFFRKIRAKQRLSLDTSVQKHVFGESRKFDDDTTQAALVSSIDDALKNYQEPGVVQENIKLQKALILANAERMGSPKEQVDAQLEEIESKTYKAVINRMLANGQDSLAKEYYSEVKKNVTGADATALERSLKVGTTRGKSQRKTDQIMKTASTLTEGLSMAREIDDPELRDDTVRRVKGRFSELKAFEKQEVDQAYLEASEYLVASDESQPEDAIPPALFSKLSVEQKKALHSQNKPETKDADKWVSFTSLEAKQIAALSLSDFQTQYWMGLNEDHRKQATDLWAAAKKDVKDTKVNGFLSNKQRLKNSLVSADLYSLKKPKEEDKVRLVNFENALDKQFQDFERSNDGKAPGPEKTQEMIDDLIIKRVFVEDAGFAFFDKEKRIVEITEDERKDAFVPIKKIPQLAIDRIHAMARETGVVMTKDKIQKIYGAALIGDDDTVQEILAR